MKGLCKQIYMREKNTCTENTQGDTQNCVNPATSLLWSTVSSLQFSSCYQLLYLHCLRFGNMTHSILISAEI